MTGDKLYRHLVTVMPNRKVPCARTLCQILKRTFSLRYRKANPSKFKYRDPTYNQKRLYVSRLLAQFLHDEVVILSVDECNLRSDVLNNKQWDFAGDLVPRSPPKKYRKTSNVLNMDKT